jgi:hypothetical protein
MPFNGLDALDSIGQCSFVFGDAFGDAGVVGVVDVVGVVGVVGDVGVVGGVVGGGVVVGVVGGLSRRRCDHNVRGCIVQIKNNLFAVGNRDDLRGVSIIDW